MAAAVLCYVPLNPRLPASSPSSSEPPCTSSERSAPPSSSCPVSSSPSSASLSAAVPSLHSRIRFNDGSATAFAPLINGCYALTGGHGFVHQPDFIDTMDLYARAGLSTFDTADYYGPSEAACGRFLARWNKKREDEGSPLGARPMAEAHIFTKFVPNVFSNKPTFKYVEQSIHKSLDAIGVRRLDLVQLHWWDYSMKGMLDVALSLAELREKGLIASVGVTNMSTEALAKIVDAGVPVVCNQVQFSLLDRRPLTQMLAYCKQRDIKLFAYAALTGGVLTNRYLSRPLVLKTSSLRMYSRVLKEAGGEAYWRKLLGTLLEIANRKSVSIAAIALRWVMQQGPVYPVVGFTGPDHLGDNLKVFDISLDNHDLAQIEEILTQSSGPQGDVYEMERSLF